MLKNIAKFDAIGYDFRQHIDPEALEMIKSYS